MAFLLLHAGVTVYVGESPYITNTLLYMYTFTFSFTAFLWIYLRIFYATCSSSDSAVYVHTCGKQYIQFVHSCLLPVLYL